MMNWILKINRPYPQVQLQLLLNLSRCRQIYRQVFWPLYTDPASFCPDYYEENVSGYPVSYVSCRLRTTYPTW